VTIRAQLITVCHYANHGNEDELQVKLSTQLELIRAEWVTNEFDIRNYLPGLRQCEHCQRQRQDSGFHLGNNFRPPTAHECRSRWECESGEHEYLLHNQMSQLGVRRWR